MSFSLYLQFFFKELNKNKTKIFGVFFTIFISLFIFSSVTILKNNIENEIENNSRVFLGGDLELSSKNKSLDLKYLESLKKDFFITEIVEFTSILRTKSEKSKTTRIKIIDKFYPLIGNVEVEPNNALVRLRNESGTILVDTATKNNLDLNLGDKIKIQDISYKVTGIIKSLPDIGGVFGFGDYALINRSSLENLEMNNLGAFTNFKYKMIAKNGLNKLPDDLILDKSLSLKYPKDISDNLEKVIENFIYFLSIISASTLLISGIGLKNSLFSFLSSNQLKIAIYKSMGLSSKNIKTLYYLQTFIILIFSSLISYISGLLVISFLDNNFLNNLKVSINPTFNMNEYFLVQGFSIIIFFIFAKPVIEIIEKVQVTDLFRNSTTYLSLDYSRKTIVKICIHVLIFMLGFCLFNVKPKQTGLFFLFFIFVGFFYYFISKINIILLKKINNIKSLSLKIVIKNLQIFRNLNSIVITTMGLGITLILFLGFISFNINKELNDSIPRNAPNYFFLGIQKSELNLFSEQIDKIDIKAERKIVPMISARILAINGIEPNEITNEKNDSFWFINGERRISWSRTPPENNSIIKGKWWNLDQKDNLKISLDYKVALDLGLKIGDSITFNIYGNSISGVITNFRKVNYRDLNINFAILFNPEFASSIPHEFMSTVKFKEKNAVNLNNLLNKLPNLTYVNISEYLTKTKNFINKLFIISIVIASFVILIGLFVISNAVNVLGKLKVYQNLILNILGFEKSKIFKLIILESIILFIPILISSLIFSNVLSYIFIKNIFGIDWFFSFEIFLLISGFFFTALILTFLISNRRFLNFNTYSLLRNQ